MPIVVRQLTLREIGLRPVQLAVRVRFLLQLVALPAVLRGLRPLLSMGLVVGLGPFIATVHLGFLPLVLTCRWPVDLVEGQLLLQLLVRLVVRLP